MHRIRLQPRRLVRRSSKQRKKFALIIRADILVSPAPIRYARLNLSKMT